MIFICYPKCSTCLKAEKYLQAHNIEYTKRDIKTDNPTADELRAWQKNSCSFWRPTECWSNARFY